MTALQKNDSPHRFLHVGFNFRSGKVLTAELEPYFNQASDWYRYSPTSWILWTGGTPDTWYDCLRPHIQPADYLLIVEMSISGFRGWLPPLAFAWLRKYIEVTAL
jgi:hypothetical protein